MAQLWRNGSPKNKSPLLDMINCKCFVRSCPGCQAAPASAGERQSHDLAVTRRCQKPRKSMRREQQSHGALGRRWSWPEPTAVRIRSYVTWDSQIMYWTGLQLNCSGSSCSAVPRSRTLRFSEHSDLFHHAMQAESPALMWQEEARFFARH